MIFVSVCVQWDLLEWTVNHQYNIVIVIHVNMMDGVSITKFVIAYKDLLVSKLLEIMQMCYIVTFFCTGWPNCGQPVIICNLETSACGEHGSVSTGQLTTTEIAKRYSVHVIMDVWVILGPSSRWLQHGSLLSSKISWTFMGYACVTYFLVFIYLSSTCTPSITSNYPFECACMYWKLGFFLDQLHMM